MTHAQFSQLTNALDAAMARVARASFRELRSRNRPRDVAIRTLDAFIQLKQLSSKTAPKIDEYFALFDMLWYQPMNTLHAWSAARDIPKGINPLAREGGKLYVYDFACGTLATLFGTLLARGSSQVPEDVALTIYSQDENEHMELIGWQLFDAFCVESLKYSQLNAVREACDSVQFNPPPTPSDAMVWVTAHHAAYENKTPHIRRKLSELISHIKPSGIVVSAREYKADVMFQPPSSEPYDRIDISLSLPQVPQGKFTRVDQFRSEVATFLHRHGEDILGQEEYGFVPHWLASTRVSWTGQQTRENSKTLARCYVRRRQGQEDDLPF